MKKSSHKKIISFFITVAMLLSLLVVQVPFAYAKTGQEAIPAPSEDTVAFTVNIGNLAVEYTWEDITGFGDFTTSSGLYTTVNTTCEGIMLSDIIDDAANVVGATLQDNYKIYSASSDNYPSTPFMVSDVKDAKNEYRLAYKVDGALDACIGFDDANKNQICDNGETRYPETYVRIARKAEQGNAAYIRLLQSITIKDASDGTVSLPVGLAIEGTGVSEGLQTYNGNIYYLTKSELEYANEKHDCWTGPAVYSVVSNEVNKATNQHDRSYSVAQGLSLNGLLAEAGVTSDEINAQGNKLAFKSTDGYKRIISDYNQDRYYFPSNTPAGVTYNDNSTDGGSKTEALLAFEFNKGTEDKNVVPTPLPNDDFYPNPRLIVGQLNYGSYNSDDGVKGVQKIAIGDEKIALTVNGDAISGTKKYTAADLLLMSGNESRTYKYDTTDYHCQGVDLKTLLTNIKAQSNASIKIKTKVGDAWSTLDETLPVASIRTGDYFVAYYSETSSGAVTNDTELRLYGRDKCIGNLAGLTIGLDSAGPSGTAKKEVGGDVANSVFYVCVKSGADTPVYYYFTLDELKDKYSITNRMYAYNDHGYDKEVYCNGFMIEKLLSSLQGVTLNDTMKVQIAEEDGFHSNYVGYVDSIGQIKDETKPILTYEINEQFLNGDQNNVSDPVGVYKDADNHSGYLRMYRDTESAGSAVIKYVMGIVVSDDGKALSGEHGYKVVMESEQNPGRKVAFDKTIYGAVPGMSIAVKAPEVTNCKLASSQISPRIITIGSITVGAIAPGNTEQTVTYKYHENVYLTVSDAAKSKSYDYTMTDLFEKSQIPATSATALFVTKGGIYGYDPAMFYRYQGVYLDDLVKSATGSEIGSQSVILTDKANVKMTVPSGDYHKYFIAYQNTQSKASKNIDEGKRVTIQYAMPKVMLVSTGEVFSGSVKNIQIGVAPSAGGSSSGGSSGGGGGSATAAPATSNTSSSADTAITSDLSKGKEGKIDLSKDSSAKTQISPSVIKKLSDSDKPLTIEGKGVDLKFAAQSLSTSELKSALSDTNAKLELGAKEVTTSEQTDIIAKAKVGESTGLFEVGGKVVDLTAQIVKTASDKTTKTEKIASFAEPVAVTIDLSSAKLTAADIANLTGIRYEKAADGTIVPVKLGGTYDAKTQTFTFYTDQFSLYGVLKAKDLKKIELKINDKNISVNGQTKAIDVAPTITNNRTMVPVRFVAEALGAKVAWDNNTKTAAIELNGKKVSLTIGETAAGMDTPAVISNGRTLVPIRYISETLGAEVLWFPTGKTVQIVE